MRTTHLIIPGKRMDVRVASYEALSGFYVQYEYSRRNDHWRNRRRPDGSYIYPTLASAKAAAKRCHANNN